MEESATPEKTRADLEWDRLLEALAARCETALGADLSRALDASTPLDETRRAIEEARESMGAAERGEPLPIPPIADPREAWERASHSGVLGPIELRAIAAVLAAARTLRRFLHARRAELAALFAACATDPSLDAIEDEIARAFEADGSLADRASPRLAQLRQEHGTARARMISRLEEIMRRYAHVLSDAYWTERDGRYVLPMRADAHERFPGIVHGASGSGATLFVEPRVVSAA
jgi:DNA mismatch repair protein MutS2